MLARFWRLRRRASQRGSWEGKGGLRRSVGPFNTIRLLCVVWVRLFYPLFLTVLLGTHS